MSILLFPGNLVANQHDTKFLNDVDTTIYHIVSGGFWEHEGDHGSWRLIARNLGWEHTKSYLYIQWLKADDEKQHIIELMTISISEFNEGNWRNIIKLEYSDNSFLIQYTVRSKESIEKAILVPGIPGKYKLTY